MTNAEYMPPTQPVAEATQMQPAVESFRGEYPRTALYNLDALRSKAFKRVLADESMGGNAGQVFLPDGSRYDCVAVNGCCGRLSGLITAWGNVQDIDPQHFVDGGWFTMRFALLDRARIYLVEAQWDPSLSAQAGYALGQTANLYNALALPDGVI